MQTLRGELCSAGETPETDFAEDVKGWTNLFLRSVLSHFCKQLLGTPVTSTLTNNLPVSYLNMELETVFPSSHFSPYKEGIMCFYQDAI